jgi:hypothetical protein
MMSDELRIYEHWCEHEGCAEWGSRGYQRGKREEPHWFCYGHRDDGELLLGR